MDRQSDGWTKRQLYALPSGSIIINLLSAEFFQRMVKGQTAYLGLHTTTTMGDLDNRVHAIFVGNFGQDM